MCIVYSMLQNNNGNLMHTDGEFYFSVLVVRGNSSLLDNTKLCFQYFIIGSYILM